MTSITQRIATLFRIKANKALDKAEDPREVLDYSYEQQREMLLRVRRGVADVATSRKRVELQVNQLRQSTGKLQGQAEQALAMGREDLAREALSRRTAVDSQITDLSPPLAASPTTPTHLLRCTCLSRAAHIETALQRTTLRAVVGGVLDTPQPAVVHCALPSC